MRELLGRDLLEVVVAKVVPAGAGVAFVAIAARAFDPAEYGRFSVGFSVANLVTVSAVVWLSQSVLRYGASLPGLTVRMRPLLLLGLALAAALGLVGPWLAGDRGPGAALAMADPQRWGVPLLAAGLSLNTLVAAYLTARQQFAAFRRAELLRAGLLVALTGVAAVAAAGTPGLVAAYALSLVLPGLLAVVWLRQSGSTVGTAPVADTPSADATLASLLRRCLAYGWPMTLWAALQAAQAVVERSVMAQVLEPQRFGSFMAVSDVVMRGTGLVLMPLVTLMHSRLMHSVGDRRHLDAPEWRLLDRACVLLMAAAGVLVAALVLARPLLAWVAPGALTLGPMTVALLGASGALWALALLVHKPLEVAVSTRFLAMALALALGVEYLLLVQAAPRLAEAAMPLASSMAACVYMGLCLGARLRQRGASC